MEDLGEERVGRGRMLDRLFSKYLHYEHHIAAGSFFVGFFLDIVVFTHIDLRTKYILLFTYLLIAGESILLSQWLSKNKSGSGVSPKIETALPFVIQFVFGGIMSGLFVSFFRSASLAQSWLFLAILIGILIGNEFLRTRYHRLEFQITIFFIGIYAFMIAYLPYALTKIGPFIFLGSGGLSILSIACFLFILKQVNKPSLEKSIRAIAWSGSAIALMLNVLYFTHTIPPIPLVLMNANVFHTLSRDEAGDYIGTVERAPWYTHFIPYSTVYHTQGNEAIYFFSSIFAPTELSAPIIHEWQSLDEQTEKWVTNMEIRFPITGGREDGYRGYSMKSSITPGKWRINVKTKSEQSLGTYTFTVIEGNTTAFTIVRK